jgi:hypothetical protein
MTTNEMIEILINNFSGKYWEIAEEGIKRVYLPMPKIKTSKEYKVVLDRVKIYFDNKSNRVECKSFNELTKENRVIVDQYLNHLNQEVLGIKDDWE